ncbi:MAG: alpha-galactosidase, partial [Treponema sp.]|nr:alpha-galactosidase [Treponema sp.]
MNGISMDIRRTERKTQTGCAEMKFSAGGRHNGVVPNEKTGALVIGSWSFEDLLKLTGTDEEGRKHFLKGPLFIQAGGWQSWSAGWEQPAGKTLPRKVRLIPELMLNTNRQGDKPGR